MILEPSSCPKTPFCVSKLPRSYFQQAERIDRTQLTSCFLQEIRAPMLKRTNAKAAVAATLVFINASVLLNEHDHYSAQVKLAWALHPINLRIWEPCTHRPVL